MHPGFKICVVLVCLAFGVFAFCAVLRLRDRNPSADPASITIAHISRVFIACEDYRDKAGTWPVSLTALTSKITIESTNQLLDGWGRNFILVPSTNVPGTVLLISYGADGMPGGAGTNADIYYLLK